LMACRIINHTIHSIFICIVSIIPKNGHSTSTIIHPKTSFNFRWMEPVIALCAVRSSQRNIFSHKLGNHAQLLLPQPLPGYFRRSSACQQAQSQQP
jgi:hypothetical protein